MAWDIAKKGLKMGHSGTRRWEEPEGVRVALSCAVPGQTAEHSVALVPPAQHQLGHGQLSSGGALGQQWWEKVLVLITLGNGLCV